MYENLNPVFADIDDYLCLDPKSILDKITKKTKAVLFVGIGGNTGQLNEVIKICKENKLKLILDAAHMAGTFFNLNGEVVHAGHGADVSVFSFQSVKNLPTADSGMICFKNDDYDELVRKLSWLGIDKDTYQRSTDKGTYKWEYDIVDVGYKYHGNSIMASMAIVGLKYLEEDNQRRRTICDIYEKKLSQTIKTIKIINFTDKKIKNFPSFFFHQANIILNQNLFYKFDKIILDISNKKILTVFLLCSDGPHGAPI
jgi:dTDP-4-amino-4,6-dideoxygalactose transaminase